MILFRGNKFENLLLITKYFKPVERYKKRTEQTLRYSLPRFSNFKHVTLSALEIYSLSFHHFLPHLLPLSSSLLPSLSTSTKSNIADGMSPHFLSPCIFYRLAIYLCSQFIFSFLSKTVVFLFFLISSGRPFLTTLSKEMPPSNSHLYSALFFQISI